MQQSKRQWSPPLVQQRLHPQLYHPHHHHHRRVRRAAFSCTSVSTWCVVVIVIVTLLCPGSSDASPKKRRISSSSVVDTQFEDMLPEEPLIDQIAMESVDTKNVAPVKSPTAGAFRPQSSQKEKPHQPLPAYTGFKINPHCTCGKMPYNNAHEGGNPHPWTAAIFYKNPKRTVISVAGESPPSEDLRKAVEEAEDEAASASNQKPAMLLFCSGVLINDRYVLTAARCVQGLNASDLEVWLSDKRIWSDSQQKTGRGDNSEEDMHHLKKSPVERVIIHPDFDPKILNHEIALLQLSDPVKLSRPVLTMDEKRRGDRKSNFFTAPVCLPKYDVMKKMVEESLNGKSKEAKKKLNLDYIDNLTGTVVSWDKKGRTSYGLVQSQVPFVNGIGKCSEMTKKKAVLNENLFCAGNMTQGVKESCSMDTGSPLLVYEDGQGGSSISGSSNNAHAAAASDKKGHYTLVGISSWLYGCTNLANVNILYDVIFPNSTAKPQVPGVYLKVAEYLDWVTHNTLDAVWCS